MRQHFLTSKSVLVIRLRRTGRINQAAYDVVVAEKANAVKGKFLEKVGSYNPSVTPKKFDYNIERINHWVGNGARPSDTVASLLKRNGVAGMEKFMELRNKKKRNKKAPAEEVKAEVATPVAEEPVAEAAPVAEEPKAE